MHKIRRVATNDHLIEELVCDSNYQVHDNGTVYRLAHGVWRQTGKAKTKKNGKVYFHLKFKGSNLLVHRIIYRRFVGKLDPHLIVNHDDGNSLNNLPENLELITQSLNMLHCSPGWT